MAVLPKPSDITPPQNRYDVVTEERLYTQTELNLEVNRMTRELQEQVRYYQKVIAGMEAKIASH